MTVLRHLLLVNAFILTLELILGQSASSPAPQRQNDSANGPPNNSAIPGMSGGPPGLGALFAGGIPKLKSTSKFLHMYFTIDTPPMPRKSQSHIASSLVPTPVKSVSPNSSPAIPRFIPSKTDTIGKPSSGQPTAMKPLPPRRPSNSTNIIQSKPEPPRRPSSGFSAAIPTKPVSHPAPPPFERPDSSVNSSVSGIALLQKKNKPPPPSRPAPPPPPSRLFQALGTLENPQYEQEGKWKFRVDLPPPRSVEKPISPPVSSRKPPPPPPPSRRLVSK